MESPGLRCASVGGPGANGGATAVGGGKGGCLDESGYFGSLMQQHQHQHQQGGDQPQDGGAIHSATTVRAGDALCGVKIRLSSRVGLLG